MVRRGSGQVQPAAEVDLSELDSLATECYKIQVANPDTQDVACVARKLIMAGKLEQALKTLSCKCPDALQDLRLVFMIHKARFVELVRKGSSDEEALACARTELAPLALDAYPEAYPEFKRLLTLLLYRGSRSSGSSAGVDELQHTAGAKQAAGPGSSSGGRHGARRGEAETAGAQVQGIGGAASDAAAMPAELCALFAPAAREELSQVVYHTVRQQQGHQEPQLVLLLLYLLRAYYQLPSSSSSSTAPGSSMPRGLNSRAGATEPSSLFTLARGPAPGRAAGSGPVLPPSPRLSRHTLTRGPLLSPRSQRGAGRADAVATVAGAGAAGGSTAADGGAGSSGVGTTAATTAAVSGSHAAGEGDDTGMLSLIVALHVDGRDAGPLPLEAGLGPSSFSESHIQVLINAAGSTRRDAIAALRHAGNDPLAALRAELSRLRLDRELLLELVEEYIKYRGLSCSVAQSDGGRMMMDVDVCADSEGSDDGGLGEGEAEGANACARHDTHNAPMDVCERGDAKVTGASRRGVAAGDREGRVPGGQRGRGNSMQADTGPCAWRSSGGSGAAGEGGATVRAAAHTLFPGRSDSQSPPAKVARCRDGDCAAADARGSDDDSGPPAQSHVRALIVQLPQLAQARGARAVVEAVDAAAPGFLQDTHPELGFGLWAAEYEALLAAGDAVGALTVARQQLGPLASAHPALQPALKATMSSLLPGGPTGVASGSALPGGGSAAGAGATPLLTAVGNVQAALQARLGLQGPRLLSLLQVLLGAHSAWLRQARISNPFLGPLRVTALQRTATPGTALSETAGPGASGGPPARRLLALPTGSGGRGLGRAVTAGRRAGSDGVVGATGRLLSELSMVMSPTLQGTPGAAAAPHVPDLAGMRWLLPRLRHVDGLPGAGGGADEANPPTAEGVQDGDEEEEEEEAEEEDGATREARERLRTLARLDRLERMLGMVGAGAGGGGVGLRDVEHTGAEVGAHGVEDMDEMDEEVDESDVQQVMEILAVPRMQAVEMLAQHGGDMEAAISAFLH